MQMPTYAYKINTLHDPINHSGTNCWEKQGLQ